ncbi:MAG: alpha/beta hydrolase [Prevotellaceae bacterium]|jgi:acetyl esterase/lipase|nr:alpha/beta hydrolase [Prevotellaceae bacterium]
MKRILLSISLIFAVFAVFGQTTAYKTMKDIPYYSVQERSQNEYIDQRCKLDIYYPENEKNFLTLVWFHGGGLTGGSKHIPDELKEKGFCVVAVNYRLSPRAGCPAYLEDAAAAVAWVFNHIAEYGGNSERIVLSGHSAGAYLSGMLGLDKSWLQKHEIDAKRIAALFLLSAQTITHFTIRKERGLPELQALIDEYAPLYHVCADAPPVYLMTGDREKELLGRYEENAYLWRMMQLAGHKHTKLYEFDGYGHDMLAPAFPLMIKILREQTRYTAN